MAHSIHEEVKSYLDQKEHIIEKLHNTSQISQNFKPQNNIQYMKMHDTFAKIFVKSIRNCSF